MVLLVQVMIVFEIESLLLVDSLPEKLQMMLLLAQERLPKEPLRSRGVGLRGAVGARGGGLELGGRGRRRGGRRHGAHLRNAEKTLIIQLNTLQKLYFWAGYGHEPKF